MHPEQAVSTTNRHVGFNDLREVGRSGSRLKTRAAGEAQSAPRGTSRMTRLSASSPRRLRIPFHPAARLSLRGLLGSGRQRLEIRNDVAPMLGVWNTDDHFCPVNIGRGVLQEFFERLLVPRDVRRFQGRREIVAGYGSALAADNPSE